MTQGNIRFARTRPRKKQEPPILRDGFVPGSTTALASASDDNGFRHSAPGRSTMQNRISPASPALRSETTSLFPAPRTGSTVRLASTFPAGRRGCTQQRFSDRSVSPPAPTARTAPADRIRPKRPTPRRPSLGNGRLLARPFRRADLTRPVRDRSANGTLPDTHKPEKDATTRTQGKIRLPPTRLRRPSGTLLQNIFTKSTGFICSELFFAYLCTRNKERLRSLTE